MSDERMTELQNFKTKDFNDCPVQTPEQLLEWLKRDGPGYQTRANAILRKAMLQAD